MCQSDRQEPASQSKTSTTSAQTCHSHVVRGSAPRRETEQSNERPANQTLVSTTPTCRWERPSTRAASTLKKNSLFEPVGQYLFWEPTNNDIPEIGFFDPVKSITSRPITPIQGPILNRLSNMRYRDHRFPTQIGNRPRDLQYPVMRPRAQPLLLHRPLQQPLRIRRQLAISPYLLRAHLRVRKHPPRSRLRRTLRPVASLAEPLMLPFPCSQYPGPYLFRALGRHPTPQFLVLHRRNLNMDINPVQQRPAHLRNISLNHRRRTHTLPRLVIEVPTRTRIHRRRQHEPRRKT